MPRAAARCSSERGQHCFTRREAWGCMTAVIIGKNVNDSVRFSVWRSQCASSAVACYKVKEVSETTCPARLENTALDSFVFVCLYNRSATGLGGKLCLKSVSMLYKHTASITSPGETSSLGEKKQLVLASVSERLLEKDFWWWINWNHMFVSS